MCSVPFDCTWLPTSSAYNAMLGLRWYILCVSLQSSTWHYIQFFRKLLSLGRRCLVQVRQRLLRQVPRQCGSKQATRVAWCVLDDLSHLEVCDHEVPLVMSPVIQATGRRIVHNWLWLHLMLTSAYCRKSSMRKLRNCTCKYSVRRFSFRSSRGFRRVSPVRGSPGTKKSELRAHQMARMCDLPV